MIFVVPSALMLLAMPSIWALTVALLPLPRPQRVATRQLTRAMVSGRFAMVTTSLVRVMFPVPRYSWTMSSWRPLRASCSSMAARNPVGP